MEMHPLDRLNVSECEQAANIARNANSGKALHFKTVMLSEPPKAEILRFLDNNGPAPARIAYVLYCIFPETRAEQLWIDLDRREITKREDVPLGFHAPVDWAESASITSLVLDHPEVWKALQKLGITEKERSRLAARYFLYGSDTTEAVPRLACFLIHYRLVNDPDSNLYAGSLPVVPVFDGISGEFVRIDWCASGDANDDVDAIDYESWKPVVATRSIVDNLKAAEFMPELRPDLKYRDIKPLHIVQPEGPSFEVSGNFVRWQKWSFRVHFTPREGAVLQDVRFDGRPLWYRLSVSEMTIPYGDPRPPLHRRQAFDFGDVGAGNSANSLELGCDCLGLIHYFDAAQVSPDGSIANRKNIMCMHEQDDGILFKHTTGSGRSRVARRRLLVVQSVFTVANYDYAVAWHFDQAASVHLELRATGIVSTQYIDPGKRSLWGTVVAPSIVANSHQHLVGVRIDPHIDGRKNSVEVCETRIGEPSAANPYGVGMYNHRRIIEKSGWIDSDVAKNRYLRVINESNINPVSGTPVGYKICGQPAHLLAAPVGSCIERRARFATHTYWITQYRDDEIYPAGKWTNQSPEEKGGCYDAANRADNVRNDDVVIWHTMGLTHHPRTEDWPIMPVCIVGMSLEPDSFFVENPAIDIPQSSNSHNKSRLHKL